MSIATELAGPSTPVRDLSLVAPGTFKPFPITEVERDAIELFLLEAISTKTFMSVVPVNWGPIGEEVYYRTYARDVIASEGDFESGSRPALDEDENPILDGQGNPLRREEWAETVRRVVVGNLEFAPENTRMTDEDIDLFWGIYRHRIMPGGRHLWVTGSKTKSSMLSRNCWVSGWSRTLGDHFRYLSARLFEGGGVGANYSSDLIAATPPVLGSTRVRFTCRPDHPNYAKVVEELDGVGGDFVDYDSAAVDDAGWTSIYVEDTREGWTDVWGTVIDSSTRPVDNRWLIDVSDVRPFGAPLKSFGGKASGPAPLVKAVVAIAEVLNRAASAERRVSGLEAMEIDHAIACSVVAGGTRRSARLAAMHWSDPEVFDFITCKKVQGPHWTANISVEIDDSFTEALNANDEHAVAVLDAVATGMSISGEPGFIDTGFMSADEPKRIRVTNPCVTGDSWVQTTSGLRQVNDLVGTGKVELLVNDQEWDTTNDGFFKTGTKPVLRLSVDGAPLRVTEDHLISTPDGWRPAGDLKVGDTVDLTDSLGNSWGGSGSDAEGYLLGHLVGDGSFHGAHDSAELCVWDQDNDSENQRQSLIAAIEDAGLAHRSDWKGWAAKGGDDAGKWTLHSAALSDLAERYGIVKGNKTVTSEVMAASSEFIVGFLRGLFDTNGHIEGSSTGGGISVRLSQSDPTMLGNVRTMLLALGIKSTVRTGHPAQNKEMPGGTYLCAESFRIIISGRHVENFSKQIGFSHSVKDSKLATSLTSMTRGFYVKPMIGTVQEIVSDGTEDVYDCQVPGINTFVANGTLVHNCGEATLSSDESDAAGESCNLGSINLDSFGTDTDGARHAFRLLSRFLYRATMNLHPDRAAGRIEAKNRRLGVGLMGLHGWTLAHGVKLTGLASSERLRDDLSSFRAECRAAADELADEMSLPRPVKVTAIAPTGTIAQLAGVTPGVHAMFAAHFIRRVRFGVSNPRLREMADEGYKIVTDNDADNTRIVEFVVKDDLADRFGIHMVEEEADISFGQFNEMIAALQETFCASGDGQAISATAKIPADTDPKELSDALRRSFGRVKGVTVMPTGSYENAPYERLTAAQFAAYEAAGYPVSIGGDSNDGECGVGGCPIR